MPTTPDTDSGQSSAYRTAKSDPHECPNTTQLSISNVRRTSSRSATACAIV